MTIELNKELFLEKVFNYEESQDWNYKGDLPCIIDFYADWCNPCKMLAPVLEQLSEEYKDKVIIYKVNTEIERELAAAFAVRSIPTLVFCPVEGQVQMAQGALPKMQLQKIIREVFEV
ncbi:thioredoxin [Aureivirga marina]|uniref:thioredoxin n=1 Tax=Aureivirga marina TaxID=1182451 RepID=UPI0018CB49F9|nr:thioredoxin [Aureivirga marina]